MHWWFLLLLTTVPPLPLTNLGSPQEGRSHIFPLTQLNCLVACLDLDYAHWIPGMPQRLLKSNFCSISVFKAYCKLICVLLQFAWRHRIEASAWLARCDENAGNKMVRKRMDSWSILWAGKMLFINHLMPLLWVSYCSWRHRKPGVPNLGRETSFSAVCCSEREAVDNNLCLC